MSKTVRFKSGRMQAGFTAVPNAILTDAGLTVGARLTWAMLAHYAWQEESAFPGQGRLAEGMGVSERSLRTYVRDLEKAGLLQTEQRGLGQTNLYLLMAPSSAADIADPSGSVLPVKTGSLLPVPVEEDSVEEDSVSSPKSPSREHPEFGQWIGRHHETFGDSVPRAGSQARARLAGAFRARRDEGLSLVDLLGVIAHVAADPWHQDRGKHDATYLLRPSVSGRLVSAWRARVAARAAAPAVDAKWSAAMAANEELQRREAEELSA